MWTESLSLWAYRSNILVFLFVRAWVCVCEWCVLQFAAQKRHYPCVLGFASSFHAFKIQKFFFSSLFFLCSLTLPALRHQPYAWIDGWARVFFCSLFWFNSKCGSITRTGASLFGCCETCDKNHLTLFTILYASLFVVSIFSYWWWCGNRVVSFPLFGLHLLLFHWNRTVD